MVEEIREMIVKQYSKRAFSRSNNFFSFSKELYEW
jgi:hypothetical protein